MTRRQLRSVIHSGPMAFAVAYLAVRFLPRVMFQPFLGSADWHRISNDPALVQMITGFRGLILLAACVAFGFSKWKFHPRRNSPYVYWLRTTPWTSRLPLPLGPTHLTVWDWIKLAVLAALAQWDVGRDPAWVAVAFGVPYFLMGAVQLAGTSKVESVALAFGLAWLLLVAPQARAMAAILGVMYFIFYIGLRGYLAALSWDEQERAQAAMNKLARSAGWPFDALGPGRQFPNVTPIAALTAAALVAWCLYCIGMAFEHLKGPSPAAGMTFSIIFGAFTALIRLNIYVSRCHPPLTVEGRYGSGRWIIPSYDRVFVAPIAILFLTVLGVIVGYQPDVSPSAVVAAVAGVSLLIALGAGPSLRRWQLTAEYRLPDPASRKRGQVAAASSR